MRNGERNGEISMADPLGGNGSLEKDSREIPAGHLSGAKAAEDSSNQRACAVRGTLSKRANVGVARRGRRVIIWEKRKTEVTTRW